MGGVEMVGGTMGAKGEEFLRSKGGELGSWGESKRKD